MRDLIQEEKTFIKSLDGFFHRETEFGEKLEKLLDEKRNRDIWRREEKLRKKRESEGGREREREEKEKERRE